ncbi:MAG: Asp-tRNA(Asn)/Glu-tRNA(Gln) amidotransferase subunit GatB [Anaerolineales bacterium]|nr:Asp-tRNA(Asn)/Glu-tRNA(Gln) amidotransferase subunit GatB [Anaerolineales bacterium]MCW5854508.1 Asp-tRNA(Asn)/Glu-tRNA(Gln) amidotransferase subunit GatB [Anaerolineales bacterium]
MPAYEAVIGLETHIQLNTASKIFCACKADSWGDAPNTNICPVCSGLPGVLPVLNWGVVEKAAVLAAAMGAEINPLSFFDRKNYFYPDLPKGYQISQFDQPLALGGGMDLPTADGVRRIGIHKLHIEEDAGKTVHRADGSRLIDFNRCGVPLVEMVTGPDLRSAEEAAQYLIRLRQLLRWLGISEADMEKGHLRADGNVSIRPAGSTELFTKTEIKNVNSIDSLRSAIEVEIERQIRAVENGETIQPWTLGWDENSGTLSKMRSKETEADYRYFREPDLLPVVLDEAWRAAVHAGLPELPLARRARFVQQYGLPEYDADILSGERALSDYYETAVASYAGDPKRVSNWLMNDILAMLNESGLSAAELKLTPQYLAEILKLMDAGTVNTPTGKALLAKVQASGEAPAAIVEAEGLGQVSDEGQLRALAEEIVAANPDNVASYRSGKQALIGWFVGQVMARTGGKADPKAVQAILRALLDG